MISAHPHCWGWQGAHLLCSQSDQSVDISAVTHLHQDPFAHTSRGGGGLCCPKTHRQPHLPVQFQLVGQHPPVMAPGLGCIQAAAQLLPYWEGDAESAGPYYGGDGAC